MAAARKRTSRSVSARSARSVWSKCQSRVIESRNPLSRPGLPVSVRGDSIVPHTIRRHPLVVQAKCGMTGPGAESRAEAYGGILESWESRTVPAVNRRKRMTPAYQRPGAWAELSAADASEISGAAWELASEGNRSARDDGCGSRSGLIVAVESRVTNRRGPASSEGDHRGEGASTNGNVGEFLPQGTFHLSRGQVPPRANPSLRRTGCITMPDPGLCRVRVALCSERKRINPA